MGVAVLGDSVVSGSSTKAIGGIFDDSVQSSLFEELDGLGPEERLVGRDKALLASHGGVLLLGLDAFHR